MAKPVSDDELQLRKRARRRLVGAVVLVLLVVVFLPMVLDEERKPLPGNVVIQIPPILPAEKAFPPPSGSSAPSAASPEPAPAPPSPTADELPQKLLPSSGAEVSVQPQATERSAVPAPPTASGTGANRDSSPQPGAGAKTDSPPPAKPASRRDSVAEVAGFVIQVGAFSKPDNARSLLERLRQARIPGYMETLRTPGGTKTKVHAGPYSTEAAALKDRDRILALDLASGDLRVVRKSD